MGWPADPGRRTRGRRSRSSRLALALGYPLTPFQGAWRLDVLAPLLGEEGRAMAQPAPGWCDPALRTHPIERFVS